MGERISVNINIPKDIKDISNAYIKANKDIFLVGGAVRDIIQGKNPKDYDLVTNALPEESKEILKDFKVSDEQGRSFGVLRVYTRNEPEGYEIASYRKDIALGRDTKGNDKKVELGNTVTIEDDCSRRDLTINALFYDIKNKEIVDLVDGFNDIENRIIKTVGNAEKRFNEDRLRILRVFRFAARTKSKIENNTALAIKNDNRLKNISGKDDVSQERIIEELEKAWKQVDNYNEYLNMLTKFNMWNEIFNDSIINTNFVKSDNFVIILANLFKLENTNNLKNKLVNNYKISNNISKKIVFLIDFLKFNSNNVLNTHKKRSQLSIDNNILNEWLILNDIKDDLMYKFIDYKPTVSAEKLMDLGFKGKQLGEEINRLEIINFKNK